MNTDLLPPNSTPLMRRTAHICAASTQLDAPLRALWQPQACPLLLLPYLARSLCVERWSSDWPPAVKRRMTQQSFTLHQHQGTIYALRQSLEPLDYRLTLQEWWQTQDPPGTFRLHIDVGSEGISQAQRHEIEHLIDLAKPASRHVLSLTIGLETHGQVTYGFTCQTGDLLTIFPLTAQGVTVTGKARLGGALHVFDTLGILS